MPMCFSRSIISGKKVDYISDLPGKIREFRMATSSPLHLPHLILMQNANGSFFFRHLAYTVLIYLRLLLRHRGVWLLRKHFDKQTRQREVETQSRRNAVRKRLSPPIASNPILLSLYWFWVSFSARSEFHAHASKIPAGRQPLSTRYICLSGFLLQVFLFFRAYCASCIMGFGHGLTKEN